MKSKRINGKIKNSKSVTTITDENIAEVIASTTGIPVKKITQDENIKIEKFRDRVAQKNNRSK